MEEHREMGHYGVEEREVYRSVEWARFCNFLLEFTVKLTGITIEILNQYLLNKNRRLNH
jgi:hypothetical protein